MDVFYKSPEDVRAAAARSLGYGQQSDSGTASDLGHGDQSWSTGHASTISAPSQSDFDVQSAMDRIAAMKADWEASRE